MALHMTTRNSALTLPVTSLIDAKVKVQEQGDVLFAVFDDGEVDYIVKTLAPDDDWERFTLTLTLDAPLSVADVEPLPEEEHVLFAASRDHARALARNLLSTRHFWSAVLLDEEGEDLPI